MFNVLLHEIFRVLIIWSCPLGRHWIGISHRSSTMNRSTAMNTTV
jgi:hypothetical protein